MYVGAVELDVLFGDVHSLKQKRSLVRPVIAELRRRFEVAAAEAGHVDLHRRSLIGVAAVAADAGRAAAGAVGIVLTKAMAGEEIRKSGR